MNLIQKDLFFALHRKYNYSQMLFDDFLSPQEHFSQSYKDPREKVDPFPLHIDKKTGDYILGFCVTMWELLTDISNFVQIKNNGKSGERTGYIVQEIRGTAKKKKNPKRVRRAPNKKVA